MELRSDIAAAASRLTSGYEVQREVRQLAAYLREGESVQRLTSGVYGAGSGLLAVTDHRVLLLRDGRSGQASEGFPLGRLSTATWTPTGPRGTITVSDSHSTAELREVPAAEGAEVVAHIQSLTQSEVDVAPIRRWSQPGSPGPVADQPGTRPGGENPWETRGRGGSPAGYTGYGHPAAPTGPPAGGPGIPVPSQNGDRQPAATGSWAVSDGWTPTGSWPAQGTTGRWPAQTTNPGTGHDNLAQGAVPVSVLARTSPPPPPPTETRIPEQQQPWASRYPEADYGDPANYGDRANGADLSAGEVPITQLAAETSQGLAVVPAGPGYEQETEPPAGRDATGDTAGHTAIPDVDDLVADQERPRPIRWSAPSRAARGGVESTTAATRAPSRVESATSGTRLPTRFEATDRPADEIPGLDRPGRGKKWMWVSAGAAGLIGLAALGSVKLISTTTPSASPVHPAPAAVNAATGPTVTITKVLDADTVEVSGPYTGTVEILGIVAPRAEKNQCGATESKAWAAKKLNNASVVLVSDPTQPDTDHAGHKQAFLRKPDGADYSVAAAKAGMAHFYDGQPAVSNAADIQAAQTQAEQNKSGTWAAPCNGKFTTAGASTASTGSSAGTESSSGTGSSAGTESSSGTGSSAGTESSSGTGSSGGTRSTSGTGSSSRSGTSTTRSGSTGTGN